MHEKMKNKITKKKSFSDTGDNRRTKSKKQS